jgi:A/G-specific adenine glycosylase
MWQGLGYYNRADNLMAAAKTIVQDYNGSFPNDRNELMKIKGIGPYTSAAIVSLAHNTPVPVVDGNVFRVLSRIYGISTPINTTKGKKEFETLAKELMASHPPAVFNQAVMEFGALYCKPANPACENCIFIEQCTAGRNKTVNKFPVKNAKAKIRNRYFSYFLIETGKSASRFLLKKRNAKDIWKNLYDLPMAEYDHTIAPRETLKNGNFKSLMGDAEFKIDNISDQHIHQLTHQKIHAQFIRLFVNNLPFQPIEKGLLLVNQSELIKYPVPRLIERYLQDQQLI